MYGCTGLLSEQTSFVCRINQRAEAATSSYSTADFLQYVYSVIMAKNHPKIRSRCLVHEFSFKDIFLTILIMVLEQLY